MFAQVNYGTLLNLMSNAYRFDKAIGRVIPFLESLQTSAQSLEQRLCIRPCSVVKFVHASVATPKISS